jgi:methionyl-tRNA formyltransferase
MRAAQVPDYLAAATGLGGRLGVDDSAARHIQEIANVGIDATAVVTQAAQLSNRLAEATGAGRPGIDDSAARHIQEIAAAGSDAAATATRAAQLSDHLAAAVGAGRPGIDDSAARYIQEIAKAGTNAVATATQAAQFSDHLAAAVGIDDSATRYIQEIAKAGTDAAAVVTQAAQLSDHLAAAESPIALEAALSHVKITASTMASMAASEHLQALGAEHHRAMLDRLAYQNLAAFDWRSLESRFGALDALKRAVVDFSTQYDVLSRSVKTALPSQPASFMITSAPVAVFTATDVLFEEGRSSGGESSEKKEEQSARREARRNLEAPAREGLEALLPARWPELLTPYLGAREARLSKNPDRARHFSSSWRALIDTFLRSAAPDELVLKWAEQSDLLDDKELFYTKEGKLHLTRRSRVLYIHRNVAFGPYAKFLATDLRLLREQIDLLGAADHVADPGFTDELLFASEARCEYLLWRFLTVEAAIEPLH